jgi:hypothetical protein
MTPNLNSIHQANVQSISLIQKGQYSNAARLQVEALTYLRTFTSSPPDDSNHIRMVDTRVHNNSVSMARPFTSIDTEAPPPHHESVSSNGNNGITDNGIADNNHNINNNVHEIVQVQIQLHGFFNRAFCLVRHNSISDTLEEPSENDHYLELLTIITLFNTALAFHRLGMAQNKARHFLTAIQVYDNAIMAIEMCVNVDQGLLLAIQLAVHLNKCHIYTFYYFDLLLADIEQSKFLSLLNQRSFHTIDLVEQEVFIMERNTLQCTFIIASAAA